MPQQASAKPDTSWVEQILGPPPTPAPTVEQNPGDLAALARQRELEGPRAGLLEPVFNALERIPFGISAGIKAIGEGKGPIDILSAAGEAAIKHDPTAHLQVQEAIQKALPGITGDVASGAYDLAASVGPLALLRPGAPTRMAREAVRSGRVPGGEVFPEGGAARPFPERIAAGEASLIGLRATIPMPEAIQKGIGRLEAPLVNAGADILKTLGATPIAKKTQDLLYRTLGVGLPSDPDLRRVAKMEQTLAISERAGETEVAWRHLVLKDQFAKLARTTGLTADQAARAVGTIIEGDQMTTQESRVLAAKYPPLAEFARHLQDSDRLQRQQLIESIGKGSSLGEAEMNALAQGADEATLRKLLKGHPDLPDVVAALREQGVKAPRKTLFTSLSSGAGTEGQAWLEGFGADAAAAAKRLLLSALDYGHVGHVLTPAGQEFFGITADPGSAAWNRQVDLKLRDPYSRFRDIRHIPLEEINRLAMEGKAPGYEGKKASGNVFISDPIDARTAQALVSKKITVRAQFLKDVVKAFGKKAGDLTEEGTLAAAKRMGHVPLELPETASLSQIVDPTGKPADRIVFPAHVRDELRGTLGWLDPNGVLRQMAWPLRAVDAYNRIWQTLHIMPFPASRNRNIFSEFWNTLTAGTHPRSWARAMKLLWKIDEPIVKAEAWNADADNATVAEMARTYAKATDILFSGRAAEEVFGHDAAEVRARFESPSENPHGPAETFRIWDDDPRTGKRVQREIDWRELHDRAIAEGQLRLVKDFGEMFGQATRNREMAYSSPHEYLRRMFGTHGDPPNTARLFWRSYTKAYLRGGEEFPRVAQWLEGVLERGLTPHEASVWTNHHHVDMTRVLRPTERRVLRRMITFYQWKRFNLPRAVRIALTRPWIPVMAMKLLQWLGSGTARKQLTPAELPQWMKKSGTYIPIQIRKVDGQDVVGFVTPHGFEPTFDLLDWSGDKDILLDSVASAFSPALQELFTEGSRLWGGKGVPIDQRTGQAMTGDEVFLGMQMPRQVAYYLRQSPVGRIFNSLDPFLTERKDIPADLNGFSSRRVLNLFSPLAIQDVALPVASAQNAAMLRAKLSDLREQIRSETRRLLKRGASFESVRSRQKELIEEIGSLRKDILQ